MRGLFVLLAFSVLGASAALAGDAPAATDPAAVTAGATMQASYAIVRISVLADGTTKRQSLNFQMGDAIDVKLGPGNLARLQAVAADKRK